ncbi:MAG: single-stranded DNA-binding protein [Clostridia bacterium]|nr:single-stranded DNA-binding protein [Clostridia bacterium]MDD4375199.1 single-stranded DNA-binding protein [Clostridia bacterium]
MNKFQFLGRLTKDPEVRYTANTNSQVTSFSLAVNRKFVSQNGERQTDFFNLTAFGKTAEFCSKYFKKGQQVLVEGRIQNRTWEDQNGQKRYATDFIIEDTYFADSKRDNMDSGGFEMPSTNNASDFVTVDDTEELPF